MTMNSSTMPTAEHGSISWPLQSFAVCKDFKSSEPARLFLDRANAEFGLIHQHSPGVAVMAQFPDTGEPIFFQASKAHAICTRFNNTCKKVSVLLQNMQIDLHFKTSADAGDCANKITWLASKTGNLQFEVHEAASNTVFARSEFSMEREGYTEQEYPAWMSVLDDKTLEWARIYKAGKFSDFTIIAASGEQFPVHRVLLNARSQYFNAVCDGRFAESEKRFIKLPESNWIVKTTLQELYEVYNPTTGSIFTGFALRAGMGKDFIVEDLLALFIACDKYNLESIKHKAAETFIDRLPFTHNPSDILAYASRIYGDFFPGVDHGLRNAIIWQLHVRLPAIMEKEKAWQIYSDNKVLVKTLHWYQYEMQKSESSDGMFTPPATPKKK